MPRKLNTIAASVVLGIMLAASAGLAEESRPPARGEESNRGMMQGGGMSGGMMSGDMQQMMANCQKMMQDNEMSAPRGMHHHPAPQAACQCPATCKE